MLQDLRVVSVHLSWELAHTFHSLRTLVLRLIRFQYAPNWTEWKTIASTALALEMITLDSIDCYGFLKKPAFLVFPSLLRLNISKWYDPHNGLPALLLAIHALSIICLSLRGFSCDILRSFPARSDMLNNLLCFAVDTYDADPVVYRDLLVKTPLLRHLRTRGNDPIIFGSLRPTAAAVEIHPPLPPTILCQKLEKLSVTSFGPKEVRALMDSRKMSKLDAVVFRRGLPDETTKDNPDFTWLTERARIVSHEGRVSLDCCCEDLLYTLDVNT